jgi:DNA polymerase-3 subunit gamma/tau
VFCTTELQKVLPTVRSRCQTFVFQRPRLPDLLKLLRRVADGEGIEVPDAALALVARSARGSFRDGVSTLDQLSAATGGKISVQDVLQLLGSVEEEVLFRLCDLVVEGNAAGALTFLEDLSEHGQDLGRVVVDLLEHLRALMLVQHTGEVPESLPVTEETRDRLREQANQLGAPAVIRLIDLLHVAVDDMRQGADPRLPLELALVKVTRPATDLSRESLAFRVERLEHGHVPAQQSATSQAAAAGADFAAAAPQIEEVHADEPAPEAPSLELEQLQESWRRTILPAVEARSIPTAMLLQDAHPAALADDVLTLEFPATAGFLRTQAEDTKHSTILQEALYAVTARRLGLLFAVGPDRHPVVPEHEHAATEEEIVELMKSTFDAREVDA